MRAPERVTKIQSATQKITALCLLDISKDHEQLWLGCISNCRAEFGPIPSNRGEARAAIRW